MSFIGGGGSFGGGGATATWDPLPASPGAKGPLAETDFCTGAQIGSQVLDILGNCCYITPHLNYSGQSEQSADPNEINEKIQNENPTPVCAEILSGILTSINSNDPCDEEIYFIGGVRTYHYLASTFGVDEECASEKSIDAASNNQSESQGSSGGWKEDTVGGGGGAGAGFEGGDRFIGGGGQSGGGGASGRWDSPDLAEETKPENSRKWHWPNPDYADLSEYSLCDPLLFGFLPRSGGSEKGILNSPESFGLPCHVDQKCLGTYSRWNLVDDEFIFSKPDQIALGRYVRKIQEYYHGFSSHLINEITMERVKWRSMSFIQFLAAPFSLAFFLVGCGQPCYKCSSGGHLCLGHGEHALNLAIAALDKYWLTDRANKDMLWPNKRFLVDYYGTIVRGPEPWIGWFFYIILKEFTCDYCGCIVFCFFVECIGPWFMRYRTISSVITFNQSDSIPQALPGKFIEFVSKVDDALKKTDDAETETDDAETETDDEKTETSVKIKNLPIDYDHFATDHVFIDGKVDFHKADLFIENDKVKAKTLSSYINCGVGCEADDTIGPVTLGSDFQYAMRTNSCGFYKENNSKEEPTRHATFLGYRTPGSQQDKGYSIRNIAIKYHNHKTRQDIWRYNWLYVDIPDPVPLNITLAQTAFDSFSQMPKGYFEDNDPLVIMRKQVYFKSILTNGALELHGGLQSARPGGPRIDTYIEAFNGINSEAKFYPFVWCDRAITKSIKAPYNLYFRSGDNTFYSCKLNQLLTDLEPGRYYFPNPYACQASPRMAPYHRSIHGGSKGINYTVEDEDNFSKYFSTHLPMQFDGVTGQYKDDFVGKLKEAKEMLGDPEIGSFARYAANTGDGLYTEYTSGPIEEFPSLEVAKIARIGSGIGQEIIINNLLDRKDLTDLQLSSINIQLGEIYKDFKNYDSKWEPRSMKQ